MRLAHLRLLVPAVVVLFLTACAALQESIKKPEISMQAVNVTGMDLNGMDVAFVLGIKNPNPLGVSLSGLSYRLDIDKKPLLKGKTKQKLKVEANSNSRLTLPLALGYRDMFDGVSALMKQDKINYALSGEIDFGLFQLPYKTSGTIDLPSLPKVSIGKVNIKRVTLSGMELQIGLNMRNANRFPIRLDNLGYNLKLANTTVAKGKSLKPVSLGAGKQGSMNLGLTLDYRDLGSVINRLKKGGTIPVSFEGKMDIPGVGKVPLEWKGSVAVSG